MEVRCELRACVGEARLMEIRSAADSHTPVAQSGSLTPVSASKTLARKARVDGRKGPSICRDEHHDYASVPSHDGERGSESQAADKKEREREAVQRESEGRRGSERRDEVCFCLKLMCDPFRAADGKREGGRRGLEQMRVTQTGFPPLDHVCVCTRLMCTRRSRLGDWILLSTRGEREAGMKVRACKTAREREREREIEAPGMRGE